MFRFSVERNITLVVGKSATGKTTLYNLISEYMRNGINSGVKS